MNELKEIPKKTITQLSDRELEYFRSLLLAKRQEATKEVETLQRSLDNLTDSDDADSSSMAHHMADVASDQQTIHMYYRLISRTRSYIGQLDRALGRIDNKTYGICSATGEPIPKGRLEVVPHTRYGMHAKLLGLDKN